MASAQFRSGFQFTASPGVTAASASAVFRTGARFTATAVSQLEPVVVDVAPVSFALSPQPVGGGVGSPAGSPISVDLNPLVFGLDFGAPLGSRQVLDPVAFDLQPQPLGVGAGEGQPISRPLSPVVYDLALRNLFVPRDITVDLSPVEYALVMADGIEGPIRVDLTGDSYKTYDTVGIREDLEPNTRPASAGAIETALAQMDALLNDL